MDTKDKIIQWLLSDDTGESSKAIVAQMTGVKKTDDWGDHPTDGFDFGRCHRLLVAVPEFMVRIEEMAQRSSQWAVLVKHWHELTQLYQAHLKKTLSKRMDEILSMATDEDMADLGNGAAIEFMSKD